MALATELPCGRADSSFSDRGLLSSVDSALWARPPRDSSAPHQKQKSKLRKYVHW